MGTSISRKGVTRSKTQSVNGILVTTSKTTGLFGSAAPKRRKRAKKPKGMFGGWL